MLSEGSGYFNGTLTNMANPLRRDTHMLRRYGHLVIQFELDNPGVWSYHCHIVWHASAGFNLLFLERPDELVGPALDQAALNYRTWSQWTSDHFVDQIDAGI